jgi:hypothetical protein
LTPQDALLLRLRENIAQQVPPEYVDLVLRTVIIGITTLMTDEVYLRELHLVRQLRERIVWLENNNLLLKQMLGGTPRPPRKRAPRGTATKAQKQAFKQGYDHG